LTGKVVYLLLFLSLACGEDISTDSTFNACKNYASPIVAGDITHKKLDEISGMAISRKNTGIIWVHNDSGGEAHIYAVNLQGYYVGKIDLKGAEMKDWEDIDIGPCGDEECIYVADIGDNEQARKDIEIYRFTEPSKDKLSRDRDIDIKNYTKFEYKYPDRKRDSEAFAIHPDGTLYIVSKEPDGKAYLYKTELFDEDKRTELRYVGFFRMDKDHSSVTAADIHENGKSLLLRTSDGIYEYLLPEAESFDTVVHQKSSRIIAGDEIHGEAVSYDPVTSHIYHTAERDSSEDFNPLYKIICEN